jgi:ketosteroid isomerase-like protein
MDRNRPVVATSDHVELVKRLYAAINRREPEAGFDLVHPGFEWRVPKQAIHSGTFRGREEVERAINQQLEVFEEFQITPEEFFERGDQLVVFVRQRGRGGASGAEVEIRIGHLWTIRAGKAVSLEIFPERRKALDAAGIRGA